MNFVWLLLLIQCTDIVLGEIVKTTTKKDQLECYTCATKYFVDHWKELVPQVDDIPYRYYHRSYAKCSTMHQNQQSFRLKKKLFKCDTRCFTMVKYDNVAGQPLLDGTSVARGCYSTLFPERQVPTVARYNITATGSSVSNATIMFCDGAGCNDDVHVTKTAGRSERRMRSGERRTNGSEVILLTVLGLGCLLRNL